jgi:N4-gp56 family major capsid protein
MAATATTLTSNVTAPVNFVLMRGLLSAARKKCVWFNGTLPGTLEKSKGSASVKWRRIENLSAATTALSEITGTAAAFLGRDLVQPSITDLTEAVAKYGNAIGITEEVDLYNVNSKSAQLMDTLGANAGESLNTLMSTVFSAGATTYRYASGAANNSAVVQSLSINDIKYCVNQLNRNSAMVYTPMGTGSQNYNTNPIRSSYYGICHHDVEEDIRDLSGFIPVEQYGGYTQTEPFEFGAAGGVRWCSTEIATISTGAGANTSGLVRRTTGNADVYSSFIYGKEAVGSVGLGNMHAKSAYEMYNPVKPPAVELIYHAPGTSGVFDPYNEFGTIAWKAFFAGKVLNSNWIMHLRTAASVLS